jgi:hypothetical protein
MLINKFERKDSTLPVSRVLALAGTASIVFYLTDSHRKVDVFGSVNFTVYR